MTAPYPPAAAGTTALGLKFLAPGAPARYTRAILEDTVRTIDTALRGRAVAPPAAVDLAAVAARVTALEPVGWTRLSLQPGIAAVGAGFRIPQYRRVGDRVELRGTVSSTGVVNGTAFAILPAGFRPTATEILNITADANAGRLDVTTTGQLIRQTGTGGYVTLSGLSFSTLADAP